MRYRFQSNHTIYNISIERQGEVYQATVDGQTFDLEILDAQPGQLDLIFGGRSLTLYWANDGDRKWVSMDGCAHLLEKPDAQRATRPGDQPNSNEIRSPMPAQVQEIRVSNGEIVQKGQIILLLEAMKMEIRVQAPYSGRIKQLLVGMGETVNRDQPLVEMDEPAKEHDAGQIL